MDSFYKNIKDGQSYVEANANAKRDFLKNPAISNAKKSPYYWSAFVYYGAVETSGSTNYASYIWIGVGIIALLVLLKIGLHKVSQRKKKKIH